MPINELSPRPIDPLRDPIDEVVKDPEGRYSAKQATAVIFAAIQAANGVPIAQAVETGRGIMSLQGRVTIRERLETARDLVASGQRTRT